MKKKAPDRYFLPGFLRKMLAAVFLLFIVSLSYAAADNDTKLITFAVKSENLNDVLIKFKDQTGVDILFNKQLIGNRECNDFEVVNQPIEVVLGKILEGTGFVFRKRTEYMSSKKYRKNRSVARAPVDFRRSDRHGWNSLTRGDRFGKRNFFGKCNRYRREI
ncbi:MAG: hypothetical protein ACLU30_14625 [Odoribacter splanchnicus]